MAEFEVVLLEMKDTLLSVFSRVLEDKVLQSTKKNGINSVYKDVKKQTIATLSFSDCFYYEFVSKAPNNVILRNRRISFY